MGKSLPNITWKTSTASVDYLEAVAFMEKHVADMSTDCASELVWLLEHPSLYTAGTSAKSEDVLDISFPLYPSGRGGQHTYHGPGQRVAYVMLNLKKRDLSVRCFVGLMEQWVINSLKELGVSSHQRQGQIGIWVKTKNGDAKIGAIGVRIRKWITYHGVAINVAPNLSHFSGIVPCGIRDAGVTSLQAIGHSVDFFTLDKILKRTFDQTFGSTN